jgi:hypothetical protein
MPESEPAAAQSKPKARRKTTAHLAPDDVIEEVVVTPKGKKKQDRHEVPSANEAPPTESDNRRISTRKRISKISEEYVTECTPKRTPRGRSKKSEDVDEAEERPKQPASKKSEDRKPVESISKGDTPAESVKVQQKASTKSAKKSVSVTHACGKCEVSLSTAALLLRHVACAHAGLARPKGESQDFTEDEAEEACLAAFQYAKSVKCYRCDKKAFISKLGLKIHFEKCGKSLEEVDVRQYYR